MKRIFFLLFIILFLISGFVRFEGFDTDILSSFLNKKNTHELELLSVSKTFSKHINVIIASDTDEKIEELKRELADFVSDTDLKTTATQYEDLIKFYEKYPTHFLSPDRQKLLKLKKYSAIEQDSKKLLYNPLGIVFVNPAQDPYLFLTDFIINLQKKTNENRVMNGRYYYKQTFVVSNLKTMNSDIEALLKFQSRHKESVYLCGTPIHTYNTSKKSSIEINIICFFSTLLLLILCKKLFSSYKVIIPIGLSILVGFLTGFFTTALIFKKIHILTLIFGTTLIGISLDYSFHYIIAKIKKLDISKNLLGSMLTTVFAFLILLFAKVELLNQIGIFTASGLLGVYVFIKFCFKNFDLPTIYLPLCKLKKFPVKKEFIFLSLLIFIFAGCYNINFSDDLKSLYTPEKNLLCAEKLNAELSSAQAVSFLSIGADDIYSALDKEIKLKSELKKQNIKSISITDFIPSNDIQELNHNLVMELYRDDLDRYATFLTTEQKESLKSQKYIKPNILDLSLVKQFSINENTIYMIILGTPKNIKTINFASDISEILKNIRKNCFYLFPFIIGSYYLLLMCFYGYKKGLKILLPSLFACGVSLSVLSLLNIPINLFHLLSIMLILGFSLDYSIFMSENNDCSNNAVLLSFISSFVSFFLISFTSFNLISSMGVIISIGLSISYLLSYIMFNSPKNQE